jgi:hypothetical protein
VKRLFQGIKHEAGMGRPAGSASFAVAGCVLHLPVELSNTGIRHAILLDQHFEDRLEGLINPIVLIVHYDVEKLLKSGPLDLCDNAVLGQVAAKGVDGCGPSTDQMIAHPVQCHRRLLLDRLCRYEAHARALNRLAARLRIGRIVLVGLHVRADELGGIRRTS